MITGHLGIARGARTRLARANGLDHCSSPLIAASLAPDVVDTLYWALESAVRTDSTRTHAAAVGARGGGRGGVGVSRDRPRGTALTFVAWCCCTRPRDYFTGLKLFGPAARCSGCDCTTGPLLDLLLEAPLCDGGLVAAPPQWTRRRVGRRRSSGAASAMSSVRTDPRCVRDRLGGGGLKPNACPVADVTVHPTLRSVRLLTMHDRLGPRGRRDHRSSSRMRTEIDKPRPHPSRYQAYADMATSRRRSTGSLRAAARHHGRDVRARDQRRGDTNHERGHAVASALQRSSRGARWNTAFPASSPRISGPARVARCGGPGIGWLSIDAIATHGKPSPRSCESAKRW